MIRRWWRFARRIFYWPINFDRDYQLARFWVIAARQRQAHRRLEWALKQTPDRQ